MAYTDPATESQMRYIYSMLDRAMDDRDYAEARVREVYGVQIEALNRGQASMLIDDLRYELMEDGAEEVEFESIFGRGA